MASRKRPNFLLFITDQQRADFLGCYGHPILRTPNIDAIAARGVAFDQCYVASPVCMPNRSSLMTGRMPSVHHVRSNGIPLSRNAVTFVDLMRDAGYATSLVGKSHLQNFTGRPPAFPEVVPPPGYHRPSVDLSQAVRADLDQAPYQQEAPTSWDDAEMHVDTPFYGFDHVRLVTGHGDRVGGDYRQWLRRQTPEADALLEPNPGLPHDYVCPQAHRTRIPEELYSTAYIAGEAEDYLSEHSGSDQPFFLMVSFPDPHHPFNPPGRYWDMYDPDAFELPEAYRRNDWTPPPHVAALHKDRETGASNINGMMSFAATPREVQEAQALTCGMISAVDDAVGRVMARLAAIETDRETVVIFTSDHGDYLGEHRLLLKGAPQYRSILRVPLVWSDPQGPGPSRSDVLTSTIDLPATILDRARIQPFYGMQGRSFLPALGGNTDGAARQRRRPVRAPESARGLHAHRRASSRS